jgi:hypothetical protein
MTKVWFSDVAHFPSFSTDPPIAEHLTATLPNAGLMAALMIAVCAGKASVKNARRQLAKYTAPD